jgi:hypothetical protein
VSALSLALDAGEMSEIICAEVVEVDQHQFGSSRAGSQHAAFIDATSGPARHLSHTAAAAEGLVDSPTCRLELVYHLKLGFAPVSISVYDHFDFL